MLHFSKQSYFGQGTCSGEVRCSCRTSVAAAPCSQHSSTCSCFWAQSHHSLQDHRVNFHLFSLLLRTTISHHNKRGGNTWSLGLGTKANRKRLAPKMLTCRELECRLPIFGSIWKGKGNQPGWHVWFADVLWLHHFLRLLSMLLFVNLGATPGVLLIVNELHFIEHAFLVVFPINDIFRDCKRHGWLQRRKVEMVEMLEVENWLSWKCNSGFVFENIRSCVWMLMKLPIYTTKVSEKYGNGINKLCQPFENFKEGITRF